MKVDNYRHVGIVGRDKETKPEVARYVDDDIGGFDAVDWFNRRRYLVIEETQQTAVDGAVRTASEFVDEIHNENDKLHFPREIWTCQWFFRHGLVLNCSVFHTVLVLMIEPICILLEMKERLIYKKNKTHETQIY